MDCCEDIRGFGLSIVKLHKSLDSYIKMWWYLVKQR